MWTPIKNPTQEQLNKLFEQSQHNALRVIKVHDGQWCWPFEQATHREGAEKLGIEYAIRPGRGLVMIKD